MEIQRRYHQLMNSRENFSKNLSIAENRKLASLYGQLQDSYEQNLTEELKDTLDQKYQELRNQQAFSEIDMKKRREHWKTKLENQLVAELLELEKSKTKLT
ncbi:hypothetical protein FNJ87_19840, partial [Nonlabens mediterrranea]|nr:hypothetical protein [Nonlabens mediterrranea]